MLLRKPKAVRSLALDNAAYVATLVGLTKILVDPSTHPSIHPDFLITCPAWVQANETVNNGTPLWKYLFAHHPQRKYVQLHSLRCSLTHCLSRRVAKALNATHGSELPYVMENLLGLEPDERSLSLQIGHYWAQVRSFVCVSRHYHGRLSL